MNIVKCRNCGKEFVQDKTNLIGWVTIAYLSGFCSTTCSKEYYEKEQEVKEG